MNNLVKLTPKIIHAANLAMNSIEPVLAPRDFLSQHAPVFIIGAPRSGSTLFYQVLVNYFDFGYLTNFHCKYYGFPSLAHRFAKPWMPDPLPPVEYQSEHGRTQGLWSPSECGAFWYRWFRKKPPYVSIQDVEEKKMKNMRCVISGLTNAFQKPLVFKNLYCSLRLAPINAFIPEAIFIVIRRDMFQNAQSLLIGRQRVHRNLSEWWSVEPPNVDRLRVLQPEQQVVGQIDSIYRLIERDARTIGAHKFLYVQYEHFCSDPNSILQAVQSFLSKKQINVNIKGSVPSTFIASNEVKVDVEIASRLIEAIEKINQDSYDAIG